MSSAKQLGFFLGPVLFIIIYLLFPKEIISNQAPSVLAVAALLITWWITEAIPIAITAFLPMILFPLLGVMKISESSGPYANPIIFLFLGGFLIALALEKHKLHERIALNLIRLTGTSGNGIILGFIMATAFLSMWISNTATAMMMLPIANSVVKLILKDTSKPYEIETKNERNFALGLMLSIGYAASLGGIATIIGTPPNVVFVGLLNDFYGKEISFAQWFMIGFPVALLLLVCTYFIITRVLFKNNLAQVEGSAQLIKNRLAALGKLRKEEMLVLIVFGLTAFLWMLQQPINAILERELLNDTVIGMTGGLFMFIVPIDFSRNHFVLQWSDTEKLSWGILFLFGGGLCLAEGLNKAGIIQFIGQWIAEQNEFSIWLTLSLIVISVLLTEVISNVALVNVFVPVVFGIATAMQVNPSLLALPVTLGASIALMSPIATPPNAIVFASGYIRIQDMVKAGTIMNIVSIIIIWVISITLLPLLIN